MKRRFFGVALLAVCASFAGFASAEDKKPAAEPSAQEKAMMEAWMKYATPGEAHKKMAALEGHWTAKVTQWMAPGAPPAESTATADFKSILGGRYVTQSVSGTMMGQPFTGFGMSGYDNAKKQTQSMWVDTMGTGMLSMTGAWDADGALTETGNMDDPMTGKPVAMKTRTMMADNDHMRWEMWMSGPDGKTFKSIEIAYTRKQ